jgi:simple sugar transport system permease protein
MKYLSAIQKRQLRGIQVMSLILILFSYVFYFNSKKVEDITFGFVIDQEWQLINEWVVASRSGSGLFLLLALLGIGLAYLQFRSGKKIVTGSFIFGFGIILAFMCWTASGKFVPFTGILQGAIMFSVPLIFGSLSGLLCEKSGVINIAIEGQLLFAACISAMIASISQLPEC